MVTDRLLFPGSSHLSGSDMGFTRPDIDSNRPFRLPKCWRWAVSQWIGSVTSQLEPPLPAIRVQVCRDLPVTSIGSVPEFALWSVNIRLVVLHLSR